MDVIDVLDHSVVGKQELFSEEVPLFGSYWQFWHKLAQVVKDEVSAIGMHVGIEGSKNKSEVYLFFYDLKLLLVSFGGDLTEILRNLGFADDEDAFVLEEGAERNLDETLIGGD